MDGHGKHGVPAAVWDFLDCEEWHDAKAVWSVLHNHVRI